MADTSSPLFPSLRICISELLVLVRIGLPVQRGDNLWRVPLSELRDKPAGTILWPALARLLPHYPDARVELSIDQALTDIVAERYDAGVRLGEQVARNMIAVCIGPDMRMAVVGAPACFATRPKPKTPHDLTHHTCIKLRFPAPSGLHAWEFEKDGRALNVRVDWCPRFPGYHLYYPSRRPLMPAFGLLAESLRYRGSRSASQARRRNVR